VLFIKKRGFNNYEVRGDITAIIIINRKHERFEVLIDTIDLQKLIDMNVSWSVNWCESTQSYYCRTTLYLGMENGKVKQTFLKLHTFISSAKEGEFVDHRNHDTLDNRRDNLRITTNKHNVRHRKGLNKNNTSGYRNVSYDSRGNPIVQLQDESGKNHIWRDFKDVHEAGEFAAKMRQEWYGDYSGE
jgi:hypothetical protein